VPQDDFAPFFLAAAENDESPDTEVSGLRSNKRKRRDSNPRLRYAVPDGYLPWTDELCPTAATRRRARRPKIDRGARDAQVRELALAGVSWPAIAEEVGLSPTRVRQLCADLPSRRAGRPRARPVLQ
jgi:hypothetical protein